jgi:hypothetical protein
MAKKRKATPAQRARARRDPAIFQPPPVPKGDRMSSVRNLHLVARGRAYPIGSNIEGDTPWSHGMDQTGTVALPVRDPSARLVAILDDEAHLQQEGVRVTINGVVYCVSGVDHDGEGLYTLTLEDEVSWQLKLFSSFRSASRARTTRYGFIQSFVDEASRKPLPKIRSFIPEVDDKQPIRKAPKKAA